MTVKLTEKQREALKLFKEQATFFLLYGGARSTKTFTILRTITARALLTAGSRHAVLRYRFNHVKSSVVYDTFPKMMQLCFPETQYHLDKSDWFVKLPNSSEIWFGGLDDKERTEKILGNEYVSIFLNETSQISYNSFLLVITRLAQKVFVDQSQKELKLKFYVDENPPSKGHWTYKLFIKKVNPTNNQPVKNPGDYESLLMNPSDNKDNLPKAYLDQLDNLPKAQRDRFYLGKFADNDSNALWTADIIEQNRVNEVPEFARVVVAVDPSGASDENCNNDEIGIGVAALGRDGIGYVLEDLTLLDGPAKWGAVVASAYERHGADRVVGESNFGGAMVEFVVKTASPNISYKNVRASRGKTVRAEPIAALTEIGKIKFVGRFDELEDELLSATTTGYIGTKSPNRLDWFVWAFTELFPGMTKEHDSTPEDLSIPNLVRI